MELLIYIAKSAGILTLFYLVYRFVLQKDTFFTANRTFLLVGIAASLLLPFATFTSVVLVEAPVLETSENFIELPANSAITHTPTQPSFNYWNLLLWTYVFGLIIMIIRFFGQLSSVFRLLNKYPSQKANGYRYVKIDENSAPFSFFNYIAYNPNTHDRDALEMILKHEKVHATQWHSIDMLLSNLIRSFQWINPFSWLYKNRVEENLEFLADHHSAHQMNSTKAYQLALLRESSQMPVPALTNNFYQSITRLNVFGATFKIEFRSGQVKKRIIMLNKRNSNKYNRLKLLLILPALALFLWGFNSETVIEYTDPPITETSTNETNSVLSFSATSTNAQLDALEAYFSKNHPDRLVKISKRKRDAQGNLFNFAFQTKFAGQERFVTRFERDKNVPFQHSYIISPLDSDMLLVEVNGDNAMKFEISKEKLQMVADGDNSLNLETKSVVPKENREKATSILGENPLYIINGTHYRANQLPKEKEIVLDGVVKMYNKEEGKEKYGAQGADGVLHFDGTSTFSQAKKTPLTKKKGLESEKEVNKSYSTKEIRIKITKNTSKEELDRHKRELKEMHNIDFSFSNINYNSAGEMTSISIQYSGKGNSGNYSIATDDEAPIQDFYFYMDTEKGRSGFSSTGSEEQLAERMAMMEERKRLRGTAVEERKRMLAAKREALPGVAELHRRELMEERREALAAAREAMREEREVLREELAAAREASRDARDRVRTTYHSNHNLRHNGEKIVITANTSDEELEMIKKEAAERGITFNYRRLKRNDRGEITSIKTTFNDGKGQNVSKAIQSDDDEPIKTIVVNM